jgi:hypothetical protein
MVPTRGIEFFSAILPRKFYIQSPSTTGGISLDCHVWCNDKVRVTARIVCLSTVDLPAAALHVQVVKPRVG